MYLERPLLGHPHEVVDHHPVPQREHRGERLHLFFVIVVVFGCWLLLLVVVVVFRIADGRSVNGWDLGRRTISMWETRLRPNP